MKNKFLAGISMLAMAVSLAACGSDAETNIVAEQNSIVADQANMQQEHEAIKSALAQKGIVVANTQ